MAGKIYVLQYIHIIALEARALVVKETQALELHFFPALGPLLSIGPRAVITDRGHAEIMSTAHSERSNWTCAWSQQASHRSLSLGGTSPRDRLPDTVSPVKW